MSRSSYSQTRSNSDLVNHMRTNPANHVGVFEAKTRLSQLIERVERGETIVITRHGAPVACLVPYEQADDHDRVSASVHGLLAFEGPALPTGLTIRQLITEGRS